MAALQLRTLQGANWQRSGGQGPQPELITPTYPEVQRAQPRNVIPIDQIKTRLEQAQAAARARKAS